MYAITATGFRAIHAAQDARPGETAVESLPQSLLDSIGAASELRAANSASQRGQADTALVNIRAYRDSPAPNNAQTVAVVKLLCGVCIALIRLQLAKFDTTD